MSKPKAKVESTKGSVQYSAIQWVFNNLSESQIAEYDNNPLPLPEVLEGLHQLVEMGFKVSAKWDSYSDCPMVTAVNMESGSLNNGLATSARGEDFADCLALLVHKILIVAQGDLTSFADEKPRMRRG